MRSMLTRRDVMDGKLQRVTMPTLIVWGTTDRLAPPSLAERLHRELPQSQVVMIPGCGHLAVIECRAKAMPAITQFLGSAAVPAAGSAASRRR
jgi:pimeloyl-ACP methyl ester carboxylesterase